MKQIKDSKIIAGFLSVVLTIFSVRHTQKLLPEFGKIPNSIIVSIVIGVFVILIIYLERSKSNFLLSAFKKLILYNVSFILFLFGWMKIFKLHLNTSIVYLDMPIGELSGYEFSTAFYGYSYSFIIFIGCLQLIGSTFLLFKRTKLLGVLILSPILANIIVTNITYSIGIGVTLMASFLLLGSFFLILEDYEKIRQLVFPHKDNKEKSNNKFNYIVTAFIVLIPLILGFLNYKPHTNPDIIGTYSVKGYSVNGKIVDYKNCNDTLLTVIYFDENQDCIFKYGNDFEILKVGKLKTTKYEKTLEVIWRYPKNYSDTLIANFEKSNNNEEYRLIGKLGKNDIEIELIKKK
jgi:hypothetical protein